MLQSLVSNITAAAAFCYFIIDNNVVICQSDGFIKSMINNFISIFLIPQISTCLKSDNQMFMNIMICKNIYGIKTIFHIGLLNPVISSNMMSSGSP